MLNGLARVYTTNIQDVLCIGLGVGIAPMDFARSGARVDVVEINPDVVPLAERWFGLERSKLNVMVGDGRPYLNQCNKKYDVIALDAFLGEGSPGHLMSREAFTAMRRVLKPGGTLVINTFATFEPGQDFFAASLFKTLTNVFPQVKIHTSGVRKNTFFVAAEHSLAQFVREPDVSEVHPSVRHEAERAYAGVVEPASVPLSANALLPDNGRVLTDNYNPVEFYDVANRERMRRDLALMALTMREKR
jgi:spermidine synthase